MVFYFFHLMPWPHLPDDFDTAHRSAWVTFSNKYYDPQRGHALYNRYLDELEHAEALGFDGICVNEHHQNTYGTMPAPNLMAAALARRTSRVKIAILGNALPLRDHPLRICQLHGLRRHTPRRQPQREIPTRRPHLPDLLIASIRHIHIPIRS